MKNKIISIIIVLFALLLVASVLAVSQCSDGKDNDLDGKIDFPADDGCRDASDNDESKLIGYADACLIRGQKLYNIFGKVTYNCDHDQCPACVAMYETGNYTTLSYKCYGKPPCGFGGGSDGGVSNENLTFELILPTTGIFSDKRQWVSVESNLPSRITMYDSFTGKVKTLCSNCYGYDKRLTFNDGQHDLTFTASREGKFSVKETSFIVDSKKPKISKTLPKKGFASGLFEVDIQEANPEKLELHYGNSIIGWKSGVINTDFCENIKGNSEKKHCEIKVNLSEYDPQTVEYWFYLEDIAGSFVESKHLMLGVDTTSPKATDNTNYQSGRYVYFNIDVQEENPDEVFYSYTDSKGKLREKTLCSRLKNGNCYKKVSFTKGHWDLTINVLDEAGNLIGWPESFDVV